MQIRTFTCDDANSPTPKSLERVSVGRGQTLEKRYWRLVFWHLENLTTSISVKKPYNDVTYGSISIHFGVGARCSFLTDG